MENTSVRIDPPAAPARPRRTGRRIVAAVVATLVVLTLGAGGVGWYYSGELLVPYSGEPQFRDLVVATSTGTVTLEDSENSRQPGTFTLVWPGGATRVGEVVRRSGEQVERQLVGAGTVTAGTKVRFDNDVFDGDPKRAHGLDFTEVPIPSELGPMPAWLVRPETGKDTGVWVVQVHGRGASRDETLRMIPAIRKLGYTNLSVTYRNDKGAPISPDGLYHLGDTEWRDAEAAVRFAVQSGARKVVLFGYSMGGAIIGQLLARSELAWGVAAVVLDAPVLSWKKTLDWQAGERGLPKFLTPIATTVSSWRSGIDFDRLELIERPPAAKPPTLVIHGSADGTVPVQASRDLAEQSRRLAWPVQYEEVPGADHVAAWNLNPAGYEQMISAFLTRLPGLRPS
ncbi:MULTISPECIES: S9 family peptidase [unclassified Crossiella]|uniref:alpha/beta hydrolase family protein n=1 Tax=unclassified Crossiella TaxID=2620835 RepID=UPI0020000B43|nr:MULTISPECIES: alpha/beta fold hydrolase [unclassified Crossiella]MCK2237029.1 alpha/beta fold hydrolase [Crossiella sp. S99.2]MCK2250697.1 alpha/beta fold hydrolase [Crossiella sp. S99.1]